MSLFIDYLAFLLPAILLEVLYMDTGPSGTILPALGVFVFWMVYMKLDRLEVALSEERRSRRRSIRDRAAIFWTSWVVCTAAVLAAVAWLYTSGRLSLDFLRSFGGG